MNWLEADGRFEIMHKSLLEDPVCERYTNHTLIDLITIPLETPANLSAHKAHPQS